MKSRYTSKARQVALLCLTCLSAVAADILFAASQANGMPLAQFSGNKVSGGFIKDIDDAIAAELGMASRHVEMPRTRLDLAMNIGEVDALCYTRPEWVKADGWHWSPPILQNRNLVVSRAETPMLTRITDLFRKRTGTVLGYRYPDVEGALGPYLIRDDAPSIDSNYRKLLVGRFEYAIFDQLILDYLRRADPDAYRLNSDVMRLPAFDVYCALSPHSTVSAQRFDVAVESLRSRQVIGAILARYR